MIIACGLTPNVVGSTGEGVYVGLWLHYCFVFVVVVLFNYFNLAVHLRADRVSYPIVFMKPEMLVFQSTSSFLAVLMKEYQEAQAYSRMGLTSCLWIESLKSFVVAFLWMNLQWDFVLVMRAAVWVLIVSFELRETPRYFSLSVLDIVMKCSSREIVIGFSFFANMMYLHWCE